MKAFFTFFCLLSSFLSVLASDLPQIAIIPLEEDCDAEALLLSFYDDEEEKFALSVKRDEWISDDIITGITLFYDSNSCIINLKPGDQARVYEKMRQYLAEERELYLVCKGKIYANIDACDVRLPLKSCDFSLSFFCLLEDLDALKQVKDLRVIDARVSLSPQFGIYDAASKGEIERIKKIIKAGLPFDDQDNAGKTPLYYALENKHYEAAALLLEQGANPNLWDGYHLPILLLFIDAGNVEAVQYLLEHGADFDFRTQFNYTHFEVTQEAAIQELLRVAAAKADDELHPLCEAVLQNDVSKLQALLANGALANVTKAKGDTILHRYAQCSQAQPNEALLYLLEHGLDVNAKNKLGETPLHTCAMWNNQEFAGYLIAHGADLNALDNLQQSPLLRGNAFEHQFAMMLIKAGADVNLPHAGGYFTPLLRYTMLMINAEGLDIVEALIKAGADVNRMYEGFTILHLAVARDMQELAEVLIQSGADINLISLQGKTPLDYVVTIQMQELLLKHGAKKARELRANKQG